ncbi:AraC family transcriptional regulator [Bacteroides thetaiotaomicron]|nr:AraC family transcriptional regulator [Bacteroides thetaiotaomicron]
MSIKNVALNLAFEDYSYFNRLFKKITGVTPPRISYLLSFLIKKE